MPPKGANWAKTIRELRLLDDETLIAQHDELLEQGSVVVGVEYYLDEIRRRDVERQGKRMERLTWVILALTIVNLVAFVASL